MTDHALVTCLWFDTQAEEAATSIPASSTAPSSAPFTVTPRPGPGRPAVMLVEFELNGQKFSALNGGPQFTFNEAVSIVVPCADQAEVDYYWDRLSDGGQEIACGWLKDRYGLCWQIVPAVFFEMVADPDPAKVTRVMQAMMGMTKFDIAGLEKAYTGQ